MTYLSHNRETINGQELYSKLGRLGKEIGKAKGSGSIDPDFRLEAGLMGSSYILGLAKAEGEDIEYEVGDIDLYVPEGSLEELNNMYKADPATEEVSVVNPESNWNQGLIVECFAGLSDTDLSGEALEYAEDELERNMEEPFKTVYDGEHLEVTLPDPETYAATKSQEDRDKEQKYSEQLEKIDEILEESERMQDEPVRRNTLTS